MSADEKPTVTPPRRSGPGGRWFFLILVILILATQIYLVRGCQQQTINLAGNTAEQFAEAFSRNVTHEFLSTAPTLSSNAAGVIAKRPSSDRGPSSGRGVATTNTITHLCVRSTV